MINPQTLSSVRKFPVRHKDGRKAQAIKWVANDKTEAEILVLHPDGSTSVERFSDWTVDVPTSKRDDLEDANDALRYVLNENFYKI